MIEISDKQLVHWTLSSGFSGFKGGIRKSCDYLTLSQINYVQNMIKRECYDNESKNLRGCKALKSIEGPSRLVYDKPDHLSEVATRVVSFQRKLGSGLQALSEDIELTLCVFFNKLLSFSSTCGNEKNYQGLDRKINGFSNRLISELNSVSDICIDKVEKTIGKYSSLVSILRLDVLGESDFEVEFGGFRGLREDLAEKEKFNPGVLKKLNSELAIFEDAITAFEKGDMGEADLRKSLKVIEAVIASYNHKSGFFYLNPISKLSVSIGEERIPVFDLLLLILADINAKIGSKPKLLNQLDEVGNLLLRFSSITNSFFKYYSIRGCELLDGFEKQNKLIRNQSFCDVSFVSNMKSSLDNFISDIIDLSPSEESEIMRVFCKQLNFSEESLENEENPWKEWDSKRYILSQQIGCKAQKGDSDESSEFLNPDSFFNFEEDEGTTKSLEGKVTPNSIAGLVSRSNSIAAASSVFLRSPSYTDQSRIGIGTIDRSKQSSLEEICSKSTDSQKSSGSFLSKSPDSSDKIASEFDGFFGEMDF